MATYTRNILTAIEKQAPVRFTIWAPPADRGEGVDGPSYRSIPGPRLLGRHLRWPRRLRRGAYDLYFGPSGQLPLGSVGMPSVLTVHDLAIYIQPRWFPAGQPLSTRLIVPRSIERATRIIASSANTARDISALFDVAPERIPVVHLGVGEEFRPLPVADLQALKARHDLPERFILFVSTIEPRKNLDTLLDAWAALPARPDVVIAGAWGWRHEPIREHIERLGEGIRFLGLVPPPELPALYNLATVLAHPAHYEGFGLTPLEAMACGTPVIASDSSSLPEVVGDAGLLIPPADASAWTAALDRVLHDPDLASDLRRRGILRAAEFTWEKAAAKTLRIMETTAGRG